MGDTIIRAVFQQSYDNFSLRNGDNSSNPLILQLGFRVTGDRADHADICFVVDHSSSMEQDPGSGWSASSRFEAVKETLRAISGGLTANDRVAMVGFNHQAYQLGDPIPGDRLSQLIDKLQAPSGGTYIAQGLYTARRVMAKARSTAPRAILLLSDGETSGPEHSLDQVRTLAAEGNDFVSLGFGASWDEVHMNEMAAIVGQRSTRWIKSPGDGRTYFEERIRQQKDSVAQSVRLVMELNTQLFTWVGVRQLSPEKTGLASFASRSGSEIQLGAFSGERHTHYLGNIMSDKMYTLIIEARPIRDLPVGKVPIGRFKLVATDGGALTQDLEPVLNVIASEPARTASTPNNPGPPVMLAWREACLPDLQAARKRAIDEGQNDTADRIWSQIIQILDDIEDTVAHSQELAAYQQFRRSRGLSAEMAKELDRVVTGATSGTNTRGMQKLLRDSIPMRRQTSGEPVPVKGTNNTGETKAQQLIRNLRKQRRR